MLKARTQERSVMFGVMVCLTACATVGTLAQTARTPDGHERKIVLIPKSGGTGCVVKDKPSKIGAHSVDDVVWRVKNNCDTNAHQLKLQMKTGSGNPFDKTCVLQVDLPEYQKWGRIFCLFDTNATPGDYQYEIWLDGAVIMDPDIEIYP